MPPDLSPFYVDILDASDTIIGDGPIRTALLINDVQRLDRIGSIDIVVPNTEPRLSFITAGSKFDVFDARDGYLGRFLFISQEFRDEHGQGTVILKARNILDELTRETSGFLRSYNNQDVKTVVEDVIGLATIGAWATTIDAGIGNTTITIAGESLYRVIDELRDRFDQHFRLGDGGPRHLEFGAFGDDADLVLLNQGAQVTSVYDAQDTVAIVDSIQRVDEAQTIFNRIVVIGSGQGDTTELTIEDATAGTKAVQSALNQDGVTSYFYVEDAASIAAFGLRTKVLSLPKVRNISNNDTDILNAKNALKLIAEVELNRRKDPKVTFAVEVIGLNKRIKPGQKVRLRYMGVVDGIEYIQVDDDFFVMDIRTSRNENGERRHSLTISTIALRRQLDADVMIDVVNDLEALKIHIPRQLAYAPVGPYVRRIKPGIPATFTVRIQEEVAALNRALLRFKTDTLKSSVTGAASGGDHDHTLTAVPTGDLVTLPVANYKGYGVKQTDNVLVTWLIAMAAGQPSLALKTFAASGPHTHPATYDVFSDTDFPQVISVSIDGIDRTAELGGTWAPINASVEVEVDITTFLVNAAGGLRQLHTVEFTCTTAKGEIEAEIDMLTTIQAIVVS